MQAFDFIFMTYPFKQKRKRTKICLNKIQVVIEMVIQVEMAIEMVIEMAIEMAIQVEMSIQL